MVLTRAYTATDPVYIVGEYTGSDTIGVADVPYAPDACSELTFVDYSNDGVGPDAGSVGNAAAAPAEAPAAVPTSWWKIWEWWD